MFSEIRRRHCPHGEGLRMQSHPHPRLRGERLVFPRPSGQMRSGLFKHLCHAVQRSRVLAPVLGGHGAAALPDCSAS